MRFIRPVSTNAWVYLAPWSLDHNKLTRGMRRLRAKHGPMDIHLR